MKKVEVIATFLDEGRIVPRRVRYYDEMSVSYKVDDVQNIYYEERNQNIYKYSIKLQNEGREIRLLFQQLSGNWFIEE